MPPMSDPRQVEAQVELDAKRQAREQCELEVDLGVREPQAGEGKTRERRRRAAPTRAEVQAVAYCALLEDLDRVRFKVEADYRIRPIAHGRYKGAIAALVVTERATGEIWCSAVVARHAHGVARRRAKLLFALTGRPVAAIKGLDQAARAGAILRAAVGPGE